MPQVFHVLRCFKCMVFQVHQVKKAIKWECKMCGEKQSRKRSYGFGTAKDCRGHVQKLNGIIGEMDQHNTSDNEESPIQSSPEETRTTKLKLPFKSKWSKFVEEEHIEREEDSPSFLNNVEVVLEVPKKKVKRKFNIPTKSKNKSSTASDNFVSTSEFESNVKPDTRTHSELLDSNICNSIKDNDLFENNQNSRITNNEYPMKTKFVVPKVNPNSKWANYVDADEEQNILENEVHNDNLQFVYTENSFITNIDQNHEECIPSRPSFIQYQTENKSIDPRNYSYKTIGQNNSIFNLCADSDLDNILDI